MVPFQQDYMVRPDVGDLDLALGKQASYYAFDVRLKPTDTMLRQLMSAQQWTRSYPPMLYGSDPPHVSLVSRQFPWRIDLRRSPRSGHPPISVADIWNILWSELHQPLTDSDWGFIRMCGNGKWEEVERAAVARRVLEGKPRHGGRVRRVDL